MAHFSPLPHWTIGSSRRRRHGVTRLTADHDPRPRRHGMPRQYLQKPCRCGRRRHGVPYLLRCAVRRLQPVLGVPVGSCSVYYMIQVPPPACSRLGLDASSNMCAIPRNKPHMSVSRESSIGLGKHKKCSMNELGYIHRISTASADHRYSPPLAPAAPPAAARAGSPRNPSRTRRCPQTHRRRPRAWPPSAAVRCPQSTRPRR